jgi:hypothetical protein
VKDQQLIQGTNLGYRLESGFQLTELSQLVSMISHSNEQHGYMAVYLRLKGIVPPSTEAMNAGR